MDWSPVIGLAGNIASGIMGMSNASDAADKAYHRQKEFMLAQDQYNVKNFRNRYQWTVQDMRAAGLNPILAATQGIGGNVTGVGLPSAPQASLPSTPDFAGTFNSARQISSQKEIAKMQNDVAKEELRLREIEINSAKEKRENDMRIDNMMSDINKWSIEEQNKRAWLMNDAQIENLRETLRIQEEHFVRSDAAAMMSAEAHMASAGAAWYSAQVQDRLADISEKTGFTVQEMNAAHKILMDAQARDTNAIAEWHEYLNDHPKVRGAVGFISSFLDVAGMAYKTSGYGKTFSSGVDRGW